MKHKYDELVVIAEGIYSAESRVYDEHYYLSLYEGKLNESQKAKSQKAIDNLEQEIWELKNELAQFQKDMGLTDEEMTEILNEILIDEENDYNNELRRLPR